MQPHSHEKLKTKGSSNNKIENLKSQWTKYATNEGRHESKENPKCSYT